MTRPATAATAIESEAIRPLRIAKRLASSRCRASCDAEGRRRTIPSRRASRPRRSEEHTSELQSLMRISYAVFCLKKKNKTQQNNSYNHTQHTKHQQTLHPIHN